MEILRGLLGLITLIGIAFVFSKHKKKINWRLVGSGVAIQIVLGILVFKVPVFANLFGGIAGYHLPTKEHVLSLAIWLLMILK
jgi:concentrative nucleoside transporter, CNT family